MEAHAAEDAEPAARVARDDVAYDERAVEARLEAEEFVVEKRRSQSSTTEEWRARESRRKTAW